MTRNITNRRIAPTSGSDNYYTPAWAVHALCSVEKFDGRILEPSCGNGAISKVLKSYGYSVKSRDLYDTGYGKSGRDFFKQTKIVDNIVTNPPFSCANNYLIHALPLVHNKLVLLLRLSFLEGVARYNKIFSVCPPSTVWVFTERATFYSESNLNKKLSGGTIAYAWFVWDIKKPVKTTRLKWLPPGFKKRFS